MEKLKKKQNDGLTPIFPLEYRADNSTIVRRLSL